MIYHKLHFSPAKALADDRGDLPHLGGHERRGPGPVRHQRGGGAQPEPLLLLGHGDDPEKHPGLRRGSAPPRRHHGCLRAGLRMGGRPRERPSELDTE